MTSRKVVVDFSAFVGKDPVTKKKHVCIKELSIVDVATRCVAHWIFEQPKGNEYGFVGNLFAGHPNSWIASHYHGLNYTSGFTSYESLLHILNHHCHDSKFVFAPDLEKAKVLEKLFKRRRVVFSLEMLGCPPLPPPALYQGVFDDEDDDDPSQDVVGCCSTSVQLHEKKDEELATKEAVPLVNKWQKCLYHHVYAPDFVCTQSNALRLADWCMEHVDDLDMNDVDIREKTFSRWKLESPSTKDLAGAGFVRLATTDDSTKCVYCGVVLYQWESGDDPFADHDFNSPYCKFVRYLKQLARMEAEDNASKGGRINHTTGKKMQYEQDEFRRRYGHVPDLTDEDLYAVCKA